MIQEVLNKFQLDNDIKIVYVTLSGSKLYGTDTPKSDTDYKGIYIPSKRDVLLKTDLPFYVQDSNPGKEKNSKDDTDITLVSIYKFLNDLKNSETGSVDILFSMFRADTIVLEDKEFTDYMKLNYKYMLNKNMKSFIGYSLSQTKKFGIKGARYRELDTFIKDLDTIKSSEDKLETIFPYLQEISNDYNYINFVYAKGSRNSKTNDTLYISVLGKLFEGTVPIEYFKDKIFKLYDQFGNRTKTIASTESKTDFKALSHSYRVSVEVKELVSTSFIKFPLDERIYIREIKEGKIDIEEVLDKIQDILDSIDILLLNSSLPETADKDFIESTILKFVK